MQAKKSYRKNVHLAMRAKISSQKEYLVTMHESSDENYL